MSWVLPNNDLGWARLFSSKILHQRPDPVTVLLLWTASYTSSAVSTQQTTVSCIFFSWRSSNKADKFLSNYYRTLEIKNETSGYLNDFYQLDPIASEWTNLTSLSQLSAPSPRANMGFTALNSVLYLFGGRGYQGDLVLPCARASSHSITLASSDRSEHIRFLQRYVHVWPEHNVVDGCWDFNSNTLSEICIRVHFSGWEALGLWGIRIQWYRVPTSVCALLDWLPSCCVSFVTFLSWSFILILLDHMHVPTQDFHSMTFMYTTQSLEDGPTQQIWYRDNHRRRDLGLGLRPSGRGSLFLGAPVSPLVIFQRSCILFIYSYFPWKPQYRIFQRPFRVWDCQYVLDTNCQHERICSFPKVWTWFSVSSEQALRVWIRRP